MFIILKGSYKSVFVGQGCLKHRYVQKKIKEQILKYC